MPSLVLDSETDQDEIEEEFSPFTYPDTIQNNKTREERENLQMIEGQVVDVES